VNACTICDHGLHGARATWTTCQRCEARITSGLTSVRAMWPQLGDCLEPSRGHSGPRVSGSAHAPLPAAEQVLNLIGPGGVPTRLYWRYADLALARGLAPQTMPAGADRRLGLALRGIDRHLPWAVQGGDLRTLDAEIGKLVSEMTAVIGGAPRAPSVPCPAELPDGSRCTGQMRYDADRRTAACRSCRTELDPTEWLGYWMELGQPAPTG
jgi:hypothetical protein